MAPKGETTMFLTLPVFWELQIGPLLCFEGLSIIHTRGTKIQVMPGITPLYGLVKSPYWTAGLCWMKYLGTNIKSATSQIVKNTLFMQNINNHGSSYHVYAPRRPNRNP